MDDPHLRVYYHYVNHKDQPMIILHFCMLFARALFQSFHRCYSPCAVFFCSLVSLLLLFVFAWTSWICFKLLSVLLAYTFLIPLNATRKRLRLIYVYNSFIFIFKSVWRGWATRLCAWERFYSICTFSFFNWIPSFRKERKKEKKNNNHRSFSLPKKSRPITTAHKQQPKKEHIKCQCNEKSLIYIMSFCGRRWDSHEIPCSTHPDYIISNNKRNCRRQWWRWKQCASSLDRCVAVAVLQLF